jgi:hypothetical protein
MQRGEIGEFGNSAGLDDCLGIFSTKLTVSMRDGNVGKTFNNEYVANELNKLIDAKKQDPNYPEAQITADNPTGQIVLKYNYTKNGELRGDKIVPIIDDNVVDTFVNKLSDNETLMVVAPENKFNALREKYKTDKRVIFTTLDQVQGSEADYVFLDTRLPKEIQSKFTTLQTFYTLITRARKGSMIINSEGLTLLNVSDNGDDPTASIDTGYNPNDAVAIEYKDTRLEALNLIPEEENNPEPKKSGSEEKPKVEIVDEDTANENQLTSQEILDEIEEDLNNNPVDDEEEPTDSDDYISGSEQLGVGLRGEKRKAYQRYKVLKNGDVTIIDIEDYAN